MVLFCPIYLYCSKRDSNNDIFVMEIQPSYEPLICSFPIKVPMIFDTYVISPCPRFTPRIFRCCLHLLNTVIVLDGALVCKTQILVSHYVASVSLKLCHTITNQLTPPYDVPNKNILLLPPNSKLVFLSFVKYARHMERM